MCRHMHTIDRFIDRLHVCTWAEAGEPQTDITVTDDSFISSKRENTKDNKALHFCSVSASRFQFREMFGRITSGDAGRTLNAKQSLNRLVLTLLHRINKCTHNIRIHNSTQLKSSNVKFSRWPNRGLTFNAHTTHPLTHSPRLQAFNLKDNSWHYLVGLTKVNA